jgi:hypothetical protein
LDVPLKLNQIKIEFKARKEYIFNPNEKMYELKTINDHLIIDYPDGNIATEKSSPASIRVILPQKICQKAGKWNSSL